MISAALGGGILLANADHPRVTSLGSLGDRLVTRAQEVRYVRWREVNGLAVPVLEGLDDDEHAVEVFDEFPMKKVIFGGC